MIVMTKTTTRCSFCLKLAPEVAKIIAGPGSFICNECVALCDQILAAEQVSGSTPTEGQDEPDVPSWSTMTDDDLLDRLAKIASVADQVEQALATWVGEARRRGASWAKIGTALAISRQAAWERFASFE